MIAADPLTLPLKGLSLVEASAGTGKTTALVRTYVRALLTTELTVDKLLVVTFTRAATGELAVRIRAALTDAHSALTGGAEGGDFFSALLALAGGDGELLLRRVRAALAAFDESAIFTIHGFCQRMLSDMAFEVGGAFVLDQRNDEQSLREEIAADFWRQRHAAAAPNYVRWLLDTFGSPSGLLEKLHDALAVSGELRVEPNVSVNTVAEAEEAFDAAARSARNAWRESGESVRDWLLGSDALKRNIYVPKSTQALLDDWATWLDAPGPCLPDNFVRLTREKLEAGLRQGAALPAFSFFTLDCGAMLQRASDALTAAWWQETYVSALKYLRREARQRKQHAREIGFDDMLQNLCDALAGKGGTRLAEQIAQRFPLALVDEFQDTDTRQYQIFSSIYGARQETGLILIGDPKQAVYRFRGADVFAYMGARSECEKRNRLFSLSRNFRTSSPLIEAVNKLFAQVERPFIYPQIPFVELQSGRDISPLSIDGEDAPLTVVWLPAPDNAKNGVRNKDDAILSIANTCADEVRRLLALGEAGEAHYRDKDGRKIFVRARDVAVLVSTHHQGDAVRQALRARNISSVTLSTDSVFQTAEAADMQTLLQAVARPASGSWLRRALATPLLGATAADIAAISRDEVRWSELVDAFREYNMRWHAQGFSAMFAQLLRNQSVIERTLGREDGERAMTNLRHLAELAESHASRHPGVEALMGWFARERAQAHGGDESRELRLESDDELIRVVTVHKAKGLEYPVVFLPFLWDAKRPGSPSVNPAVLAHDRDTYKQVLDLGSGMLERRRAASLEESQAEQIRLTYVALTRAVHACYVLCTPANYADHSALSRLLDVDHPGGLKEGLKAWCEAVPTAMHLRAPQPEGRALKAMDERPRGEARAFTETQRLRQRSYIASYSFLTAGAGSVTADSPDWDETTRSVPFAETATGIHAFPAGAASGTFLHALLETTDFDAETTEIESNVRSQCAAHGIGEQWIGTLVSWMKGLLATPLVPVGCTLAQITRRRRVDEMEFYFPTARLSADAVNALLPVVAPHRKRSELDFADIAGQMKGYIDLVFEWGGRYWLVDYKSNRLGDDVSAYTPAVLDHAMTEHHYDLQYVIYMVALHRYLGTRIRDYHFKEHFGGVMYLFLRGMAPDAPMPRGVWYTCPGQDTVGRFSELFEGSMGG